MIDDGTVSKENTVNIKTNLLKFFILIFKSHFKKNGPPSEFVLSHLSPTNLTSQAR